MSYILLSQTECPPGEFFITAILRDGVVSYTDVPCGSVDNTCQRFGPSPLIDQVAKDLGRFLKSNGLPGYDFATCLELIDRLTCQRLNNSPRWCRNTDRPYAEVNAAPQINRGCGCCGAKT